MLTSATGAASVTPETANEVAAFVRDAMPEVSTEPFDFGGP